MDCSKYVTKLKYPTTVVKPRFRKIEPAGKESVEYLEKIKKYEEDCKKYEIDRIRYSDDTRYLLDCFWKELKEELGIEDHPLTERLCNYAWDHGYENGLASVYGIMSDLVYYLGLSSNKKFEKKVRPRIEIIPKVVSAEESKKMAF
jgi:hypothetical protein